MYTFNYNANIGSAIGYRLGYRLSASSGGINIGYWYMPKTHIGTPLINQLLSIVG